MISWFLFCKGSPCVYLYPPRSCPLYTCSYPSCVLSPYCPLDLSDYLISFEFSFLNMHDFFLGSDSWENLLDLLTRREPLNNTEVCLSMCDLAPVVWALSFKDIWLSRHPGSGHAVNRLFRVFQASIMRQLLLGDPRCPRAIWDDEMIWSPPSHPSHILFSNHLTCFCDGRSQTTSVQRVILDHFELKSYLLQLMGEFSCLKWVKVEHV